jgi:hypothetical protein
VLIQSTNKADYSYQASTNNGAQGDVRPSYDHYLRRSHAASLSSYPLVLSLPHR